LLSRTYLSIKAIVINATHHALAVAFAALLLFEEMGEEGDATI
jgi:hypothetical protein